ncbi:hypothetical protein AUJ14_04075 [Candidatus Micrarchaeota archaeon CG1_02_55_22]|nr:MAG: hypothetical protein AUJ14_04075 [Candidatus Micrarchaeota archaeon CG1_02_55_22]
MTPIGPELLLYFAIGLVSGAISLYSVGASFFSIPAMALAGLPPATALATNRFGVLGGAVGGTTGFSRLGIVPWRKMLPYAIVVALTSIIGALAFSQYSGLFTTKSLAILLLVSLAASFAARKYLSKVSLGSSASLALAAFLGLYVGAINVGYAIFLTILLVFSGFSFLEAAIGRKVIVLASEILSLAIFSLNPTLIDWPAGIALFAGSFTVSIALASHAVKLKDSTFEKLFYVFALVLGVLLLFK